MVTFINHLYCTILTSSDSHRSQGLWPVRNVTDVPGHRSFCRKRQNSGHKRKKCVFLSRKNKKKSQPPEIISLFSKVQKFHMKIALLGRFASVKFFIFILVYLKDL